MACCKDKHCFTYVYNWSERLESHSSKGRSLYAAPGPHIHIHADDILLSPQIFSRETGILNCHMQSPQIFREISHCFKTMYKSTQTYLKPRWELAVLDFFKEFYTRLK